MLKFKLCGYTGTEEHKPDYIGKNVVLDAFNQGRNEVLVATIYKLSNYKITAIDFKKTQDGKGIEWILNNQKYKVSIYDNILILEADSGKKWLKYRI